MDDKILDRLSDVITVIYSTPSTFALAYGQNPDLVLRTISNKMKVVPIDLKSRLEATYRAAITTTADDVA